MLTILSHRFRQDVVRGETIMDISLVLRSVFDYGPLLPSTGPQWPPAISMGAAPKCGFYGYCRPTTASHYSAGLFVRPTTLLELNCSIFRIH
jgi:hypothetical protein